MTHDPMTTHALLTTLRGLRRRRGYTAINVLGLALGLTCCLLAGLYVFDEWRTDRFHAQGDRIVRVVSEIEEPNGTVGWASSVGQPVARVVEESLPEVEAVARLTGWNTASIHHDGAVVVDERVLYASADLFSVFDGYDLVHGDPATALHAPYTLVLTAAAAARYFDAPDPVGQTLTLNDTLAFTVSGVVADPSGPSHIDFDVLVSWATLEARGWADDQWFTLNSYLYVLLRDDADNTSFAAQLEGVTMRGEAGEVSSSGYAIYNRAESLTEVYLWSEAGGFFGGGATGNPTMLAIITAVAVFVLLIAGLNFVNLATAQSLERAREVGVRKAMGAGRGSLVRQFLIESAALALAAVLLAMLLTQAALPSFNGLTGEALSLAPLLGLRGLAVLVCAALFVGLAAGAYPSLALTRFAPVDTLRGTYQTGSRGTWLRRGLVVTQFALTIALLAGTFLVRSQVGHMRTQSPGFDAEHVFAVDLRAAPRQALIEGLPTVLAQYEGLPGIEAVSAAAAVPGRDLWEGQLVSHVGQADASQSMHVVPMLPGMADVLGLDVVAGRTLSADRPADVERGLLLNETAARRLGFADPADALGARLQTAGQNDGIVTGVLADYHHYGLQQDIAPTLSFVAPWAVRYAALRLAPSADLAHVRAEAETLWAARFPGYPFTSFFLDADFEQQYRAETQLATVFSVLAGLAVFVACLGLLGLTSYSVNRRTKEIGVRKVLGASAWSIVRLFSTDVIRLVVVAAVVTGPVVYLIAERWLDGFAVRVDSGAGWLVVAAVVALTLAVGTVAMLALRAARLDPVDALRFE
ncbi:MAG: ABC transporter permease [Bacteroidota bacterium]